MIKYKNIPLWGPYNSETLLRYIFSQKASSWKTKVDIF